MDPGSQGRDTLAKEHVASVDRYAQRTGMRPVLSHFPAFRPPISFLGRRRTSRISTKQHGRNAPRPAGRISLHFNAYQGFLLAFS
jgi:hypothetical protein